jgi:hypothetical protein
MPSILPLAAMMDELTYLLSGWYKKSDNPEKSNNPVIFEVKESNTGFFFDPVQKTVF